MAMYVGKEIADLKQMSVRELREKYEAVFGEPTRAGNRDWLFKRIAWRIQALAEGDLSERARRRAEFRAEKPETRIQADFVMPFRSLIDVAVPNVAGQSAGRAEIRERLHHLADVLEQQHGPAG